MKTPPLLLAAALVFWGRQTEYLLIGILLGIIIELPRVVKARWDFSDDDFSRIWVFCTLLFLGALVFAFTSSDGPTEFLGFIQHPNFHTQRNAGAASSKALALWLRWLPLVFFPFAAAQAFSSREGIPLATISLLLRRRWRKIKAVGGAAPPAVSVNVSYIYFALCLFSASIFFRDDLSFFCGLCVLVPWALWRQRSRRFAVPVWALILLTALGLGFAGQSGISHLRSYLERFNPSWLTGLGGGRPDPSQARTALGKVGRIKLSGRIVIRVQPKPGTNPPQLLREASYRTYKSQIWYSDSLKEDFIEIRPETNGTTWVLVPGKTNANSEATISCYVPGGEGLLPVPSGASRVDSEAGRLSLTLALNGMGAVKAQGPGLVIFDARHGPGATADTPGGTNDVNVTAKETKALARVIEEASLPGASFEETLRKLNAFFQTKFTYATWQPRSAITGTNDTPLSRFLIKTRSGHCEYFATATVLLLRQLGIPARYAVGYAVHESSGKGYVVRQRDAHAWCLVWDQAHGIWRDFDTTPASWVEEENKHASVFQAIQDAWSRLAFEFSRLRWGQTHLRQYILWALVPVLLVLFLQILLRSRRQRQGEGDGSLRAPWPGQDSEFYQLTKVLARAVPRSPGETLNAWLERVASHPAFAEAGAALRGLLSLHYRYRFDPRGLDSSERAALRRDSRLCLERLGKWHR